jgi:hypothetical protein
MITRINTLRSVGRFIQLHSPAGGEHAFAQFNVILASNAAGKSTLCDVLRSLTTGKSDYILGRARLDGTGAPEVIISLTQAGQVKTARFQNNNWIGADRPKIHIFDDRFVADNVLVGHHINVEQRRNLYGLVIGDEAIALQAAVNDAERALSEATETERAAKARLESLIPQGFTIDSFRTITQIEDVDARIATARSTLEAATQAKRRADAIRQRRAMSPIPVSAIPANLEATLSSTLTDAAVAAEQIIRNHLATHTRGLQIEWVAQGHRAATHQACPHCGQNMEGLEILAAYNAYFSGELQRQERARAELTDSIERRWGDSVRFQILEIFTAHETERDWWKAAAGFEFELPPSPPLETVLSAHQAVYRVLVDALSRKNASPSIVVAFTEGERAALENWAQISESLSAYNAQLAELNRTLERRKGEVENLDLRLLQEELTQLEAARRRHEQAVVDAYLAYDRAASAKTEAQRNKQRANERLREQTNAMFAEYGARINELLRLFAANFRLVAGGTNESYVSFTGGSPSGQLAVEILGRRISTTPADAADPSRPSLANTLSGGDRSALALAFFLAKVEREPQLADSIVVFDDPFHSQDRSRQRRTIEQITNLAMRSKQCFVLSHDIDFARAVAPAHGFVVRTFCLDPLANQTVLECKELPMPPSRAYEQKYILLTEFIRNPEAYTGQLHAIAGTLRTILEEYLQLKFPCRWETGVDWLGIMIAKIRSATGTDVLVSCQGLVPALSQVNDYSQRFHHRSTGATADVPDVRELLTYAEQTLSIIHQ